MVRFASMLASPRERCQIMALNGGRKSSSTFRLYGRGWGSADPQHRGNHAAQVKNKQELRIISSDLAAQSCAGTMGAPPSTLFSSPDGLG